MIEFWMGVSMGAAVALAFSWIHHEHYKHTVRMEFLIQLPHAMKAWYDRGYEDAKVGNPNAMAKQEPA